MPDPIVEGQPAVLGQINNQDPGESPSYFIFVPVKQDGTRRVQDGEFREPGFSVHRVGTFVRAGETVGAAVVGWIPIKASNLEIIIAVFHEDDFHEGIWMAFRSPWISRVPVTPGDDYYDTRTVLDEHATRFVTEHNPANLRLTKANVVRIEHLSHELSDADRTRSANTDEYVRERLGYIWWRNEQFRKMPFGTPELDAAWRAERDAINILKADFCEVCAGSGLSIRIIRKHPRHDWRTWLMNGIRFSVNKQFQPRLVEGAGMVTPEVQRSPTWKTSFTPWITSARATRTTTSSRLAPK